MIARITADMMRLSLTEILLACGYEHAPSAGSGFSRGIYLAGEPVCLPTARATNKLTVDDAWCFLVQRGHIDSNPIARQEAA